MRFIDFESVRRRPEPFVFAGLGLLVIVTVYIYISSLPYSKDKPLPPGVRAPEANSKSIERTSQASNLSEDRPKAGGVTTANIPAVNTAEPQISTAGLSLRPAAPPPPNPRKTVAPVMGSRAKTKPPKSTERKDKPLALASDQRSATPAQPLPAVVEPKTPKTLVQEAPGKASLTFRGFETQVDAQAVTVKILTAQAPTDFSHFSLTGPPRWVFDFPGKWRLRQSSPALLDHPLVKKVRVGQHTEKIRVVVEMSKSSATPPRVTIVADGLLIRFE